MVTTKSTNPKMSPWTNQPPYLSNQIFISPLPSPQNSAIMFYDSASWMHSLLDILTAALPTKRISCPIFTSSGPLLWVLLNTELLVGFPCFMHSVLFYHFQDKIQTPENGFQDPFVLAQPDFPASAVTTHFLTFYYPISFSSLTY